MINAKKELIEHIKDRPVKYIHIAIRSGYHGDPLRFKGVLDDVLPNLDFSYDSGYGGQYLFGFIWYEDGTWSERGEYDGSEWWEKKEVPTVDVDVSPY